MHQPPPDGDPTAALARLAAQVDRIDADLTALRRLRDDVETHTRTLRDLTDLLRRLTPPSAGIGPAKNGEEFIAEWLTLTDPTAAVLWLTRLHGWVREVWNHYERLPACWPWHPDVIAELLACQQVWAAALSEQAPPEWLAGWHDRWRPGAASRIRKAMAACIRAEGLHVAGAARYHPDPAYLDEIAHWWATTHGTHPAPGLTPA